MTSIFPVLRFRDPVKAIDWLEGTLGFRRGEITVSPEGRIVHAELRFDDDVIMISGGEPEGPAGVYLAVDDADAHHDRAKAAGAEITMELVDQPYGSREYACRDPEGNSWYVGTYRP